ncbi:hypothetical protein J437_LFUL016310 [Ladona fulva]|uniref:Uncharacterized protein n=1 Tax=Ladona fulva TaxID=123851 RepID=A0A8K0KL01_LADFU|nr:hypothetical protein J437_LFUL016310 [Ladona fulva]
MEACNIVERELDVVLAKFGAINDHARRVLLDIVDHILSLKKQFEDAPTNHELTPEQINILKQAINKVRETVQLFLTDHRVSHNSVSKVGKAIDRNFVSDFASTSREDVFLGPDKVQLLNQVICQHFYRQGMLDIAEELAKEAGLKAEEDNKEPFSELNRILDCLKAQDLGPALDWACAHRENLLAKNSSLEFKLHRLRFVGLIKEGPSRQAEAVQYARTHFPQFVQRHDKEIQSLMGTLLFLPQGIRRSPYNHLLDPNLWVEICDVFTRDACMLLGLSVDSPLSIKIDLGPECTYHSVFACPILRQQCSESNPPLRLVCGHVISRDALNKLSSGNKVKCPYCPVEMSTADARHVYF